MNHRFSELVSAQFARLIAEGAGTVARQVTTDPREEIVATTELVDPIADVRLSPVRGITHRYPNRVLLKPTGQCPVHCRFCFRRDQLSTSQKELSKDELDTALAYIHEQKGVNEVILTGGDPLMLTDERLDFLLAELGRMPHIGTIRIHTRIPSTLAKRVTPRLVEILTAVPQMVWLVAHINSAEELAPECSEALTMLRKGGVGLLAQTVLLRGVNDSVEALELLFTRLVQMGVKPYYLHYPDLVRGTSHFRLPFAEAVSLVGTLQSRLSGIAVPHLVVDLPSGAGKISITPSNYEKITEQRWRFRNPSTGTWEEVEYTPFLG